MEIVPLADERLADVATLVARLQTDPAHHVGYLSVDREVVAAELTRLEPDPCAAAAVLLDGDAIAGALLGEWDSAPPRVWWHGPFADASGEAWHEAADALYASCRPRVPASVTEEELAADAAHSAMAGFAARHGFLMEEGSSILHLDELPLAEPDSALDVTRPTSVPADVARLHEACFPGAHRVGADLVGEERRLLVARTGEGLAGYAAVEVQPSGDGYLDFVGVDPAMRRQGVGRALVAAATQTLAELECLNLHLTVRESNHAARALYEHLGFTEERVLRPYRKGFSLRTTVAP